MIFSDHNYTALKNDQFTRETIDNRIKVITDVTDSGGCSSDSEALKLIVITTVWGRLLTNHKMKVKML